MTDTDSRLLRRTTCPHCWHNFAPENVLWVSAHSDLLGDPKLGPEQQQRFLPTRFGVDGSALDSHGVPCLGLACPNCHLPVPRGLLETEPFFMSILGAPGCGKSYLLAAMTWQLRQALPGQFAVNFQDVDLVANAVLNGYEQALFLNPRQDERMPLGDLIAKTEVQGALSDTVLFGNHAVSYPRPFLFTLTPADQHPNAGARQSLSRILCLYDNAGEHFQPGMDSTHAQATRHLALSRVLFFLFDPTQDERFRRKCGKDLRGPNAAFSSRQEVVLLEVAARVRRLTNLPQTARHPHPLFVLVTKHDAWAPLIGDTLLPEEPWRKTSRQIAALDGELIAACSGRVRQLLMETCPEVVGTAEGFAQQVVYFPVSALGQKPEADAASGRSLIRPRDLKPFWTTVPFIYGLHKCLQGMIASVKAPGAPGAPRATGRKLGTTGIRGGG